MTFTSAGVAVHRISTPTLVVIGTLFVVGSIGVFGYRYFGGITDVATADLTPLYEVHDEAFTLLAQGQPAAAQAVLAEFLLSHTDPALEEQTKLTFARNALNINVPDSITAYKELVRDQNNSATLRATAAEELALVYILDFTGQSDVVTEAIFNDEPFTTMRRDSASLHEAYLRIFAHANEIEPRLLASSYLTLDAVREASPDEVAEKVMALDRLLFAASDTYEYKPLALTLRALISSYLSTRTDLKAEVGNADAFWGQALATSEYFVTSLQSALQREGKDVSRFDYNASYFGKGRLFAEAFKALSVPGSDQSMKERVTRDYMTYLASNAGADERVRLQRGEAPLATLKSFAETDTELATFLEKQGLVVAEEDIE